MHAFTDSMISFDESYFAFPTSPGAAFSEYHHKTVIINASITTHYSKASISIAGAGDETADLHAWRTATLWSARLHVPALTCIDHATSSE